MWIAKGAIIDVLFDQWLFRSHRDIHFLVFKRSIAPCSTSVLSLERVLVFLLSLLDAVLYVFVLKHLEFVCYRTATAYWLLEGARMHGTAVNLPRTSVYLSIYLSISGRCPSCLQP